MRTAHKTCHRECFWSTVSPYTCTSYLKVSEGPIPHIKRWIVTTKRKVREDVNSCILIQLERENLAWVGCAKNTPPSIDLNYSRGESEKRLLLSNLSKTSLSTSDQHRRSNFLPFLSLNLSPLCEEIVQPVPWHAGRSSQ